MKAPQPYGYIMGYFTESPDQWANAFALHLVSSRDGRNWTTLHAGRPVLIPEIGEYGMRDPFLFRKQDGHYIVVGTNMWNSESILCYDSPNLIHFQAGRLLHMNRSGMHARQCQPIDQRKYQLPPNAKHVSILSVNEAEWNRLMQTYEPPTWCRLRVHLYPHGGVK